ncbi:Ig-like domain-containing protein [Cloacibacterium sp.]|uniref:Ig-like domain-containing protein n=1 Tax=Cloacibacterium sp. TaxID=1913682 RepID=UPI0039E44643
MITKRLLLLLLLWPFLMWSQTDLVKWYNADFTPSLIENHITASNITTSNISKSNIDRNNNDPGSIFYSFGGFPAPVWNNPNTLDANKYIQFAISPENMYKIELNSFNFNAWFQGGNGQIEVRYSKDQSFSKYSTLFSGSLSGSYGSGDNKELSFPSDIVVNSGETMYVRIFAFNTNNELHIEHNNSGTLGPNFKGKVSLITPTVVNAYDDKFLGLKNQSISALILDNDDYKYTSAINAINITKQPEHGTLTINGTSAVTYKPNANYVGYDNFYYTITNAVGVSNSAKVELQVIDNSSSTEQVLTKWINADLTPKNYVTGVSGNTLTSKGLSMSKGSVWPYDTFSLSNLPSPKVNNGYLDENNYLEFAVKAGSSDDYTALLSSFKFEYYINKNNDDAKFSLRYSKDANFKTGVYTVDIPSVKKEKWTSVNFSLDSSLAFLYPGEVFYVRLYVYNTWNSFMIKYDKATEAGSSFSGYVSPYYPAPCSVSAVWNASGWVNNVKPDINKKAIINADYDTLVNGSFEACSVQVNKGKLSISKDKYVKVNKTIETTNGGSIEVQSDGNLFQLDGSIINSSAIKVLREASLKYKDYNYWGTPVLGQNLKAFSPNTPNSKFYTYSESKNNFTVINPTSNNFVPGMGYAIRAEDNLSSTTSIVTAVYTGIPNNGDTYVNVDKSSVGYGYNLIGNPYPSDINFDDFYNENKNVINNIAYLWTNVNPNPAMQGSAYPSGGYINNYAIINGSGGVPAASPVCNSNAGKCSNTPSNIMRIGQGFIVQSKLPGTNAIVFKNSMRKTNVNAKFFNRVASKTTTDQTDRFWLQLTTPLGVTNKILIAYKEEATNDFEIDYDAPHMVIGSDSFYSILSDKKLAIQGRHYPLLKDDAIPLGASFYGDGTYTISMSEKEGIFANGQNVYLKDKLTGVTTNLSENSYSFSASIGQDNNRFEIIYVNTNSTLGTGSSTKNQLVVYQVGGLVKIESPENMNKVALFDMAGKVVYQDNVSGKTTQINSQRLVAGVYILNIQSVNGKTSKKIIIK